MSNRGKMGTMAQDSMTVQHIAQALEQKSTTTSHIQQRLANVAPIQGQTNGANSVGGNGSPQSNSTDKKPA